MIVQVGVLREGLYVDGFRYVLMVVDWRNVVGNWRVGV